MITKKRSKSKKPDHIKLVARAASPAAPLESRVVEVPRFDSTGKPLEDWRVGIWHLQNAANSFARAFRQEHDRGRAKELDAAYAVVTQVQAVLDGRRRSRFDGIKDTTIDVDRGSLLKMAQHCESYFHVHRTKKRAEDWLWEHLPRTSLEARQQFPDHADADDFNKDGARNLSRKILGMLASQRHDDAAKVLRRWGIDSPDHMLRSPKYHHDTELVREEILDLWSEDVADVGTQFNELLIRRTYRILRLARPLEARNRSRRRRDLRR